MPYSCIEPRLQHIELQRADDADQRRRAVTRPEHLHHALLRHLLQRLPQLLRLHGIGQRTRRTISEQSWDADKGESSPSVSVSPIRKVP